MTGQQQRHTSGRAATVHFVGGCACLNFTNTTSGRGGDHQLEHLLRYEDLLVWSRRAGLLSPEAAAVLADRAAAAPAAAAAALARAHRLREALHALFAGSAAPRPALETLNDALRTAMVEARLRDTGHGFAWDWSVATPALDQMLWPLAREAALLLTSPARRRVKMCPGLHCGWLFLDKTKNGRRRWCDMRVCGSRAKARRHHRRKRAARDRAVPG